jgi:hypothetical protein
MLIVLTRLVHDTEGDMFSITAIARGSGLPTDLAIVAW